MLLQFISGALPAGRVPELMDWIKQNPDEYAQLMSDPVVMQASEANAHNNNIELPNPVSERMLSRLMETIQSGESTSSESVLRPGTRRFISLPSGWLRYAAAVILFAGAAAMYYYLSPKPGKQETIAEATPNVDEILPGNDKATLTLSDGSVITIDNTGKRTIAEKGSAIAQLSNGELVYKRDGSRVDQELLNTMSTPNGGQFQLKLEDGTRVWLNAASSITFPAVFVGKERRVKITGEVYFEVSRNKNKPFIVDIDGNSLVEVLGTQFNIDSYADDGSVRTTLLEGSVRVSQPAVVSSASERSITLKPGQQARTTENEGGISVLSDVDLEKVMAWKNGFFNFNGASLSVVMHQLERWYDINVKFEGKTPNIIFEGEMDRGVKLGDVLDFFDKMNIKHKMEGRTLVLSER